jgi:hypothetical protein
LLAVQQTETNVSGSATATSAQVGPIQTYSPSLLFAASEQGAWYDPSDLTTMFQDNAGTTPVSATGQAVGLLLDKSKGLVLGSEIFPTLDLSSTQWETLGTLSSVTANSFTNTSGAGAGRRYKSGQLMVNGPRYVIELSFTKSDATTDFQVQAVGGTVAASSTAASGTLRFRPTSDGTLYLRLSGNATLMVTALSVKELPGNHAVQATAANRPIYGVHPFGGRRNLLSNSAFTGAVVGTVGSGGALPTGWISTAFDTVQVVEIGTYEGVSAIRIKGTRNNTSGASVFPSIRPAAVTTVSGVAYIGSAVSKLGPDNANLAAMPSLLIQTPSNSPSVSVPADWGIISSSSTATGTPSQMVFGCTVANGQVGVYDFWVSAPQFEVGTARTAYQRVTDQYNVTEAGVASVSYLFFDGVNDSMSTSSINFTSTDKMSVFAGVRKLSDVAQGIFAELSASTSSNNGTFRMTFPGGSGAANYAWLAKGTLQGSLSTSGFAAPITSVVTGEADIAGDNTSMRTNGVSGGSDGSDLGTGTFGNYPLFVGARNGASLPFSGHLYSLIVRGALSSSILTSATEGWVASKTGVVIA